MAQQILIVYYSYSSQTRNLLQRFAAGLEGEGATVNWLPLRTREKLQFPLGSFKETFSLMITTFLRRRLMLEELDMAELLLLERAPFVILAGPTWSYNPSGPVLYFFDRYGERLTGKTILPFISCRGYWRSHALQLKFMLLRLQCRTLKPLVFLHPGAEPWRTIGVFLKLAGKLPEKSWMGRYYRRFGHSLAQVEWAEGLGNMYGAALRQGNDLPKKAVVVGEIRQQSTQRRKKAKGCTSSD